MIHSFRPDLLVSENAGSLVGLTPRDTTHATAAGSQATQSTDENSSAPSFTAVFAQIAAEAAAAGTTVASFAPASSTATASTAADVPANGVATAQDDSGGPAGSLFGSNPWLTNPTEAGPGPVTNYNPIYFATQQTAQTVAQMIGGTVVQANEMTTSPGSPFSQNQPNFMVQMPDGAMVNPGLVADIYTHGWNQSFVNQQVSNEVAGDEAAMTT